MEGTVETPGPAKDLSTAANCAARKAGLEETKSSNEKRALGCLGYIGDYTIKLYGNYDKPL